MATTKNNGGENPSRGSLPGSTVDRYARRKLINYIFVGLTSLATAVAISALVMILYSLVAKGFGGLNLTIFTVDTPGGGEELGGLRALNFYHRRAALQASSAVLAELSAPARAA